MPARRGATLLDAAAGRVRVRVVLFGATGMVGQGVLLEALDDPEVTEVLAVGRRPTGRSHPKLREVQVTDFADLSPLQERFAGYDACFFCLGVSSVGMSEADYSRVTFDYTMAAAKALLAASPGLVFVYVSGMGTDSTEKGRSMWARVKGRTENRLLAMPFRAAYMFRPGFIQPERGIRSRTAFYRAFYAASRLFGGLLVRAFPGQATTTGRVGRAMIQVARTTPPQRIVEAAAINALAKAREVGR